jgi:hypothetical protein
MGMDHFDSDLRLNLVSQAAQQLSDLADVFRLVWFHTDDDLPSVLVAEADDLVSSRQGLDPGSGWLCVASETRHLSSS